jgi:hypothetical protein
MKRSLVTQPCPEIRETRKPRERLYHIEAGPKINLSNKDIQIQPQCQYLQAELLRELAFHWALEKN